MTESMEHAAAVKLQERIDSIALAMAQVKEEQDQVKVALRGGDAYLGMTRQVLVRAVYCACIIAHLHAAYGPLDKHPRTQAQV